MSIKKEAPVIVLLRANAHAQCMTGALFRFDLAHIIEIKDFVWLDDQLVLPVFFDVKGVSLVRIGQILVFWMLRYIKLITEKWSNASKLQNTFAAVHDSKFIPPPACICGIASQQSDPGHGLPARRT